MQNRIDKIKDKFFKELYNNLGTPLIQQKTYSLVLNEQGFLQIKKESMLKINKKEIGSLEESLHKINSIKLFENGYQVLTYSKGYFDNFLEVTFSQEATEALIFHYEIKEEMEKEFNDILILLANRNTDKNTLEKFINKYKNKYKKEVLEILNSFKLQLIYDSGKKISCNLLHMVCKFGYTELAELLIDFGVNLEQGTSDVVREYNNLSPLIIACTYKQEEMVQLLLEKGANFLHITGNSVSVLMYANDPVICQHVIKAAEEKNALHELLSYNSEDNRNALLRGIESLDWEFVNVLTSIKNFHLHVDLPRALDTARKIYWNHPDQREMAEKLCIKLRAFKKSSPLDLSSKALDLSPDAASFFLFGFDNNTTSSKEKSLHEAISQATSLLSNPLECVKYLRILNNLLVDYCEAAGTPFPALDANTYQFKTINDLYYPIPLIPETDFKGIKKSHALENVFIKLFKPYDLGAHIYKWIGFIPHKIADQIVIDGDIFIETPFGIGLVHGMLSHMIQTAILILATKKEIQLKDDLTIKEFLAGFITTNRWGFGRDSRLSGNISFTDPFRLNSLIMYEGHKLQLNALADSLIDSFCKGYQKLLKAFQTICSISSEELLTQLNDLDFTEFQMPQSLIKCALDYEIKKGNIESHGISLGGEYAVIKRDKQPYKSTFKSRFFNNNTHSNAASPSSIVEKCLATNPTITNFN